MYIEDILYQNYNNKNACACVYINDMRFFRITLNFSYRFLNYRYAKGFAALEAHKHPRFLGLRNASSGYDCDIFETKSNATRKRVTLQ